MSTYNEQHFSRETEGLSKAVASTLVRVADGEHIELRIAPVEKHI